jgi:CheY-like chemotaxis protein
VAATAHSPDREERQEASLVIVLVEDNDDIRESMQEFLLSLGHRVEVAGDGEAGLALILRLKPDVALVDVGLPTLDGYQVAERVRQVLDRGAVRLVALTGYGQESDRRRTQEAGFDAHLVKPAEMDALIDVLSSRGT